ncbi:MAG: DUF115 domain-containing protein [Lachnospiraceae bacterium]|nr:DUF115 domain-containing protein [Lachnospiraceae bacterium]
MNKLLYRAKSYFKRDGLFYRTCRWIYLLPRNIFYKYGYLNNYIAFPIKGFFRKHHIKPFYNDNYAKVEALKNKHAGKRCFIIATGPSLTLEDVESLDKEITIGVNSIFRLYNKTSFRPTYYVALDPDVEKIIQTDAVTPVEDFAKENIILNPLMKKRYSCATYVDICYQNHWFNYFNPRFRYEKNLKNTKDVLWGIYDKYTITNAAIDLAIYMGCKEIYLLGVDCNYKGKKKYFSDPGKEAFSPDELQAELIHKSMMAGYEFEEKMSSHNGVRIYNATRGGMLEVFERVKLDDII